MNYNYQHIVVLGAAESGLGSALLAVTKGFSVFVSDAKRINQNAKEFLGKNNIDYEENGHSEELVLQATLVIKSPGIPSNAPLVLAIKAQGIPVISEIEFARSFSKGKTICITGSNGKTTTSLWIYHILKKAGYDVGLAGNIGVSYAKQVAQNDFEWYVLELSSFQLDDMFHFMADIAVMTNISPDHLDRYNNQMALYIAAKFRILQNMDEDTYFIYNADDLEIVEMIKSINTKAILVPFSATKPVDFGAYIQEESLIINIKTTTTMSIHELALKGKHNAQNALAAGIAARLLEIRPELVRESLTDFENVEHRLEFVAKIHGVEFINDSKATNINATWYALESMDKPTVWIVGGVDKGNDYAELIDLVKSKVKAIVCLGTDNKKIIEAFSSDIPDIIETQSAQKAVEEAYRLAGKEGAVLLSPACASFDLFSNYEDRGQQFKKAVRNL